MGLRAGGGPRNDVSSEEIIALYERGVSAADIAEKVGMTQPGVLVRLRRHGVPIRPQGGAHRYVDGWNAALDRVIREIPEVADQAAAMKR